MDHSAHAAAAAPQGLQNADQGYRLTPALTILDAGRTRVEFVILGPDGAPVTDFDVQHEKKLHFIAVQRDTGGFQHVHPVMDPAGTWSVDLDLAPGVWRLFADIVPAALGSGIVLGADLAVPGEYRPVDLLAPRAVSRIDDYEIVLDGALRAGTAGELTATVTRGGVPVTDLEPYLAAYGHLVALRAGDLAFLHVHPEGSEPTPGESGGPAVAFRAQVPTAGRYLLYLDFQVDGVVRTASFVVDAASAGGAAPTATTVPPAGGHAGH